MVTAILSLREASVEVRNAFSASDFFGPAKSAARRKYREFAQVLHPDHGGEDTDFQTLERLWSEYSGKSVSTAPITIATRRATYIMGDEIATGDIATLYRVSYQDDKTTKTATLKMVRNPVNNDLLENEAASLRKIQTDGDSAMAPFVSMLLDSFRMRDTAGVDRQVNIFEPLDGWYSLADVVVAYPDGLNAKDAAWMWRRLLFAVGYAHSAGVIHGAITPEHVMIEPAQHGLMLIDWCYSKREPFGRLTAVVPSRLTMYPSEALDKEPISPATDIYMATRTMETLLNSDVPSQIKAFIRGCTAAHAGNAWQLREEFDELIERLWGKRTFRPFTMRSTSTI